MQPRSSKKRFFINKQYQREDQSHKEYVPGPLGPYVAQVEHNRAAIVRQYCIVGNLLLENLTCMTVCTIVSLCAEHVVSCGVRGLDEQLRGVEPLGVPTVIKEDGIRAPDAQILTGIATYALTHSHELAVPLPTAPAGDLLGTIER